MDVKLEVWLNCILLFGLALRLIGWCQMKGVKGYTQCFLLDDIWRCPYALHNRNHVTPYGDQCYEFVVDSEEYWDVANADCKSRNGHLVVIKDAHTQRFIMDRLNLMRYAGNTLWIGLSDGEVEQEWTWVTGERLKGYTNWKAGENESGVLHKLQDCVSLEFSDSGLWYDGVCHVWPSYYNYICQYDRLPATTIRQTTTTSSTTVTSSTSTTTTTSSSSTSVTPPPPPRPPTTTTTSTSTASCSTVNCSKTCTNGYTGLSVGSDGCIQCHCS